MNFSSDCRLFLYLGLLVEISHTVYKIWRAQTEQGKLLECLKKRRFFSSGGGGCEMAGKLLT